MAKKKNTPLKDEQVYSFEDLYQKLDEIQNTINNKNVQEAHELLSSPVSCNRECTVDSDKLTKSVAGAMDSYMQSNHVKIVKDDEESDTEQTKSLLEDYRNELVEIKAQPATPVVTIIDKNIVEAAVTTVIEKEHTNATFITKPERPTSLKGVPGYLFSSALVLRPSILCRPLCQVVVQNRHVLCLADLYLPHMPYCP